MRLPKPPRPVIRWPTVSRLYQDRLARSLASIINVLDPDAIVLGGGLSNLTSLYQALPALLQTYTFSADAGTPIVRASHGDSSGVRGAAWLWPETTSAENT